MYERAHVSGCVCVQCIYVCDKHSEEDSRRVCVLEEKGGGVKREGDNEKVTTERILCAETVQSVASVLTVTRD